MNLSVGIVGLPNVGKSTLFNALLKKQQAFVANYPFATIEPNIGVVPVPDYRLEKLAEVVAGEATQKPPIVPATVNFVDIAGLVKGAAEGAGLGNKFLSHIREVSVIAHVVRAFVDENIIKEGSTDPKSDYETINTELALADLQTVESVKRKAKSVKNYIEELELKLNDGKPAREVILSDEEKEEIKQLFLLTAKPEIVVLNVAESDYTREKIPQIIDKYAASLGISKAKLIVICAKIEAELAALSGEEQKEYLTGLGLEQSGLERLIKKAYETLNLISFLTAGEKEVRGWSITRGTKAPQAAGTIHTDFEKKFIKAEVVDYTDFIGYGGWKKARELGKVRLEGREYEMREGDVVDFKIGT